MLKKAKDTEADKSPISPEPALPSLDSRLGYRSDIVSPPGPHGLLKRSMFKSKHPATHQPDLPTFSYFLHTHIQSISNSNQQYL